VRPAPVDIVPDRVLIAEDDPHIVQILRSYLEQAGFMSLVAHDGERALHLLRAEKPDALVLDLRMPQRDGLDVLRIVRADRALFKTTVVVLTALATEDDKVLGLELGADDYVTKPFNPREVVARVKAQLRKARTGRLEEPAKIIASGAFRLDADAREITFNATKLELTRTEYSLMCALMEAPRHVLTRDDLIERCLGFHYQGMGRALDTHVRNLRKKLLAAGVTHDPIATVYGIGYRWQSQV
jgi:DNA-binding response OmpR family regulator